MNYWNDIIGQKKPLVQSLSFSSPSELINENVMANIDSQPSSPSYDRTSKTQVLGYPQILELSTHPELQSNQILNG